VDEYRLGQLGKLPPHNAAFHDHGGNWPKQLSTGIQKD
jgi:hypothetical protein